MGEAGGASMKKIFVCISGISLIVMACHHHIAPSSDVNTTTKTKDSKTKTVTTTDTASKTPSLKDMQGTNMNIPDLQKSQSIDLGKTVFSTRCNKCHELKNPGNYTASSWNNILKRMAPNAHLTLTETDQVTAYLIANAKQ